MHSPRPVPLFRPRISSRLAMSGWIVGPEAAAGTLTDASALWKARSLVRDYLRAEDEGTRAESLSNLQTLKFAVDNARPERQRLTPETLTKIIQLMHSASIGHSASRGQRRSGTGLRATISASRPSTQYLLPPRISSASQLSHDPGDPRWTRASTGTRLLGERGRASRLHHCRAGVYGSEAEAPTIATRWWNTHRSSFRSAMPASGMRLIRTGSSWPAGPRRQRGTGLRPVTPRPRCGCGRYLGNRGKVRLRLS